MYPTFDIVKLEHLQGYLYARQLVSNVAFPSGGAMKQYSIYEIKETEENQPIIDLGIYNILKMLEVETSDFKVHKKFLIENASFKTIKDWKNELPDDLFKWFSDDYLSRRTGETRFTKYTKEQKDWTVEQRLNFIKRAAKAEKRAEQTFREYKPCSKYFINLTGAVLGTMEPEVLKVNIPWSINYGDFFSGNTVIYRIGMSSDIYILRSDKIKLFLHLANVLT